MVAQKIKCQCTTNLVNYIEKKKTSFLALRETAGFFAPWVDTIPFLSMLLGLSPNLSHLFAFDVLEN